MQVLTFPEYAGRGRAIATAAKASCHVVELHRFPDGESRVRIPTPLAEHVVVVRALDRPNEKLVELMLVAETARRHGARQLSLIAPYLCYMRQDMEFEPGEAVSQRIVGRFLAAHFDDVITVDSHLHRISRLDEAVPAARALNLCAAGPIGDFLRRRIPDPLVVGPDSESEQWVQLVAEQAGTDYVVGSKQRFGDRQVSVVLPHYPVSGRHVVLVDDVASTGRTLGMAAALLRARGARQVDCVVTHAVFADDAFVHLRNAGVANIWSTDTIEHRSNAVTAAPLIASALALPDPHEALLGHDLHANALR